MRFVILGSGTGSNAEALLNAWSKGQLGKAEPVAIFSDNADARILTLGEQFGVTAKHLDLRTGPGVKLPIQKTCSIQQ